MTYKQRILVITPSSDESAAVERALLGEGFAVTVVRTPQAAAAAMAKTPYDWVMGAPYVVPTAPFYPSTPLTLGVADSSSLRDIGPLHLDRESETASLGGNALALTRTEFRLLWVLTSRTSATFSRDDLIRRVWPEGVVVSQRTVDVNITRLRTKLGRFASHIRVRMGMGYYFEE